METEGVYIGNCIVGSGKYAPRKKVLSGGREFLVLDAFVKSDYGKFRSDDPNDKQVYSKIVAISFDPSSPKMREKFFKINPGDRLFVIGEHTTDPRNAEITNSNGEKEIRAYANETIRPIVCNIISTPIPSMIERVLSALAYKGGLTGGGVEHWTKTIYPLITGEELEPKQSEEHKESSEVENKDESPETATEDNVVEAEENSEEEIPKDDRPF
jgi:hypothetical protein